MKIVKYNQLQGPCGLWEAKYGTSSDAVPKFEEQAIYSNLMNKSSVAFVALNPDYLNFNDFKSVEEIKKYFQKAIKIRATTNFTFVESLRDFFVEKSKYKLNTKYPYALTPDGIFCSLEDYFIWQKYYYKHPTSNCGDYTTVGVTLLDE